MAERPGAGSATQRKQMREELAELDARVQEDSDNPVRYPPDVDQAVARRQTRHALAAVLQVLDEHPADAADRCTRCRRRQVCPAGELLRIYAAGWLMTGGLAERREGDRAAISTRRG